MYNYKQLFCDLKKNLRQDYGIYLQYISINIVHYTDMVHSTEQDTYSLLVFSFLNTDG
jgi:hypothetical protein